MKMRDLIKMTSKNDGSRTLFESTMIPEIIKVLQDWTKENINCVLIGGLALSHHSVPRMTIDVDFLFFSENDIPDNVKGFKRIRPDAFQHNKTHVEIELLSGEFLKISPLVVKKTFETAISSNGLKIASASCLVALKLYRLSMQDKADIISLLKTGNVSDLTEFNLPDNMMDNFHKLVEILKTDRHSSEL
jgi:hypothetical protein